MLKILRWYPLLLGCLVMAVCGEIFSAVNGHYLYYPPLTSIPLRDALLGIALGSLTILLRRDRARQRTRLILILAFVCSFLSTTTGYLFAFLSYEDVSFIWGDVLETTMSALLTAFLLDQLWKWYVKEECRWILENFFHGFLIIQIIPYPLMDKPTRILSLLISLSFILAIVSSIPPTFFAPNASSVTITLVPSLTSDGTSLTLLLPTHSLWASETQMIKNTPDDPHLAPSILQTSTMRQETRNALQLQEEQLQFSAIDISFQCQTSIHQSDVTVRCQELAYDSRAVHTASENWLKHSPGMPGYRVVGSAFDHVSTARLRTDKEVLLSIDVWGLWAYAFSSTQLRQLANQLTGMREEQAESFLRSQKGLDTAWLSTIGQSLPTDPHHIHFQILIKE